jgi:hypothetical protein
MRKSWMKYTKQPTNEQKRKATELLQSEARNQAHQEFMSATSFILRKAGA